MIAVIIVDDEYLVIERLKHCIDWAEAGYAIAGQAGNGEDALELVEQLQPQVAIVDINMPLCDGLEFAKIARGKYPRLKTVILSGYSSFEYARSALQVGVENYLLKPVNTDELQRCLAAIKQQIEQETQFQRYLNRLEDTSQQSEGIVKEKWLQSLLKAQSDPEEQIAARFREYFPDITFGRFRAAVVWVNESDPGMNLAEGQDQKAVLPKLIQSSFSIAAPPVMFSDPEGRTVLLIKEDGSPDIAAPEICAKVRQRLQESGPGRIVIGISDRHGGMAEIGAAYQEALVCLENGIVFGADRVIAYGELEKSPVQPLQLGKIRQNLLIALRLKDGNSVAAELEAVFHQFEKGQSSVTLLHLVLAELLLIGADFTMENGGESGGGEGVAPSHAVLNGATVIRRGMTLEEIKKEILSIYRGYLGMGQGLKRSSAQRMVEQAKKFIDANYHNPDISLEFIAGHIFVNPSHLSSIFKKETGLAIMEYVRERRMLKAQELLARGSCNIADIAATVGFHDENYFSKCFKKRYGVAPSALIQNRE